MARKNKRGAARAAQRMLIQGIRVSRRLTGKRSRKAGAPPGTVVHTGVQRVERTELHLIRFGPDHFEEREVEDAADCFPLPDDGTITWLDIDGLHDTASLERLGEAAKLHPLVLEDVVSIGQRPKQEEYENQHYIVLRMLELDRDRHEVLEEQISIVVGPNYVLSFQEAPGDVWESLRERLRSGKGHIRQRGADYLAYALMDAIVDGYFTVVETLGDQLERLETDVMENASRATIGEFHHLKGELLVLRKAVWPLRDLFNSLIRDESRLFSPGTKVFLRDAHDHAYHVIDTVETMRDVTAGLIDLYLSSVSIRMNETIRVLTIIGTLFIPLTFIVGIYGMNFDHMPELHWRWSYAVLWAIMLLVVGAMVLYFRRRHWF